MEPDRHHASPNVAHTTLSVLFLVALVALTASVLSPFVTSVLWATIVSVATWPFLLRLQALLGGRRGLAVALVTVTILLVVFVPVTLALATIARNAQSSDRGHQVPASRSRCPRHRPSWRRFRSEARVSRGEWRRVTALSPEERSAVLSSLSPDSAAMVCREGRQRRHDAPAVPA